LNPNGHPGKFSGQMRFFCVVMFVWLGLSFTSGNETDSSPVQVRQSGEEYIRLQTWAEGNGLQLVWTKREEELQLTNRWTKLVLRVNYRRAEVNGVALFLSFPVILREGEPCIAERDASRSLGPILSPPKNKPGQEVRVIALGAGHGGKDSGFRAGAHEEKTYTLLLAREIQKLLSESGLKAVLIRNADRFVALEERAMIAQRARADLYLELHYNSAGAGSHSARGVEVYCLSLEGASSTNHGSDWPPQAAAGNRHDHQNLFLAYQIQKRLVQDLGAVDRGIRRARFAVLRDAEMPAVLIEAGFMSEPDELRRIIDPVHRRKTAQAVVNALLAYKRLIEH
jgi:N-acetylmuramoyl-L-alanine amidase